MDLVDADRVAVDAAADRDQDLEHLAGVRSGQFGSDVRPVAIDGVTGECIGEGGADREAATADGGIGGVDGTTVARPDRDALDVA
jgi:hypothetical protein